MANNLIRGGDGRSHRVCCNKFFFNRLRASVGAQTVVNYIGGGSKNASLQKIFNQSFVKGLEFVAF